MKTIPAHKGLQIRDFIHGNLQKPWDESTINRLFGVDLTADEIYHIYKGEYVCNFPTFSYYRKPISNTTPCRNINLAQLFFAITGDYYKQATQAYRSETDAERRRYLKLSSFDSVTFAGAFSSRKSDGLLQPSGYAVFDFDHLPDPAAAKRELLRDEKLDVEMLFISPSGQGLKMVLHNSEAAPYDQFYSIVLKYTKIKHPDLAPYLDEKTKDTARACFVCHDPDVFIKNEYLRLWQSSQN